MTDDELDQLFDGATKLTVVFGRDDGGDGSIEVTFMRHELATPVAFRAALRRALGHERYEPPRHDQESHDEIVRMMFEASRLLHGDE